MPVQTIFPISRIHQPLSVKLETDNNIVTDAWCSGILFRGFEMMMKDRHPPDAALLLQRICGICSSAHAICATLALEDAYKLTPAPNGKILRNLIYGADILQNHLRHFYVLVLPDYVKGPDIHPFRPTHRDLRLPEALNKKYMDNYWRAIELSATAHQMMALFGAKAPHQQTIFPTGVTASVDSITITGFRNMLNNIKSFVENVMTEDALSLGIYYPEYFEIGKSIGNFMSFGMLEDAKAFPPGIIIDGTKTTKIKPEKIIETVASSWYTAAGDGHPSDTTTVPKKTKENAYSWVKAPRYDGQPVESGPLARAIISEEYQRGTGTLDRIIARALETEKIAGLMERLLDELELNSPNILKFNPPSAGEGVGLTDSMRGVLGHWVKIEDGRIAHYQVITPTAWNFSPRDENNVRGPVEQMLIGTEIDPKNEGIEVGRIIRSLDPCFTCAVH